jgi:hypothetical protein
VQRPAFGQRASFASLVSLTSLTSLVLVGGAAALSACSNSTSRDFEETAAADAGNGSFIEPDAGDAEVVRPVECADDTKDIFVISEENALYRFHPPDLSFTNIGILNCPTGGASPTSMAVDRAGIAWVRHSDGSVWKVGTKDLSCEATAFASPDQSFLKFGMGFATETKGGSNETLYLSDSDGAGLAKVDTSSLAMRFIGPYTGDLAGRAAELTGTGDGKLYGFFVTSPAQIAEIAKGTGEIVSSKELTGVYAGNAWAFSFYGGDFYIYTSSLGNGGGPPRAQGGSDVTRYRPSDGSIEVVKSKIGFKIVGAGVSTCAPTTGPS